MEVILLPYDDKSVATSKILSRTTLPQKKCWLNYRFLEQWFFEHLYFAGVHTYHSSYLAGIRSSLKWIRILMHIQKDNAVHQRFLDME